MRNLSRFFVLAAVLISPAMTNAATSKCEFSVNTIDETTGERTVQTEFDSVITSMSFRPSEANGSIAVGQQGGQRYLAVKFDAIDHFPLPPELAVHEDPSWDPTYRDWLDGLLGDTAIYPAGSTVRLDLDDQTSVTLATEKNLRIRTHYAEPGQSVSANRGTNKAAKKFVGFLAKMAGEDINTSADASRYHSVATKATIRYPIDAEAGDILRRAAVISLRLESRDRYYDLAYRTTREFVGWSDKSYLKIRDAMQCVDEAVEG